MDQGNPVEIEKRFENPESGNYYTHLKLTQANGPNKGSTFEHKFGKGEGKAFYSKVHNRTVEDGKLKSLDYRHHFKLNGVNGETYQDNSHMNVTDGGKTITYETDRFTYKSKDELKSWASKPNDSSNFSDPVSQPPITKQVKEELKQFSFVKKPNSSSNSNHSLDSNSSNATKGDPGISTIDMELTLATGLELNKIRKRMYLKRPH